MLLFTYLHSSLTITILLFSLSLSFLYSSMHTSTKSTVLDGAFSSTFPSSSSSSHHHHLASCHHLLFFFLLSFIASISSLVDPFFITTLSPILSLTHTHNTHSHIHIHTLSHHRHHCRQPLCLPLSHSLTL